jgi:hypothetical protein
LRAFTLTGAALAEELMSTEFQDRCRAIENSAIFCALFGKPKPITGFRLYGPIVMWICIICGVIYAYMHGITWHDVRVAWHDARFYLADQLDQIADRLNKL